MGFLFRVCPLLLSVLFLFFTLFMFGMGTSSLGTASATVPPCSVSYVVTSSADLGSGTLREALAEVCDGGTITFASALDGVTIHLTSGHLSVTKGVKIDASALPGGIHIDGGGNTRIFVITADGARVIFKHLNLAGGMISNSTGGAIMVYSARYLRIEDVMIQNSTALSGGGIYKSAAIPEIHHGRLESRSLLSDTIEVVNSVITGSSALYGGGIYVEEGLLLMSNSTVTNNQAAGDGSAGGGLYLKNGRCKVTGSLFQMNSSQVFGGAIYMESNGAECNLEGVTLSNNLCIDGAGGGIYINGGVATMTNHCIVSGNDANFTSQHGHGGGVYLYQGSLTTNTTRFSNNTADVWGGGLFLHDGQGVWTSVNDTLLSNSSTDVGGGAMIYNGAASFSGTAFTSNTSPRKGGGLYLFLPKGSVNFTNCQFTSNVSSNGPVNDVNHGGAMYIDSSLVYLNGCTFISNKATRTGTNSPKGGAIYLYKGTLHISNSTFNGNETNTTQGRGGAIFVDYGSLQSSSTCRFINNKAGRSGGAIFLFRPSATATLQSTIFSSNSAGKLGGGVYMENGTLSQDSCAYVNNSVSGITQPGGGGMNHNAGTSVTTNSYFSGNIAEGGAGIYFKSGSATFSNVLVTNNMATAYGGGIFTETATANLTINNGTFYGNTAPQGGGGLANQASASIQLNNCIFWGNSTQGMANQIGNQASQAISINYSCYKNGSNDVAGNILPVSCITQDPNFADAVNNDFRLLFTSPCLDKGNNTYNTQIFDIRGAAADCRLCVTAEFARKLSKTTGLTGTIDMGAYEFNPTDCTGIPSVPVASGSTTCYGVKDTLRVSGITGIAGWYDAETGGSYLGGDSLLIFTSLSVTNSITVYVQDSTICGASLRTPVTLTVNSALAAISGVLTACDQVSLTAAGGGSYAWSGGVSTTSAVNNFTSSGTYIVTVTDAINGCSTSTSAAVTVNKASAAITGVSTACDQVSLVASGGTSYLWSGGASTSSASNSFTSSGSYTVTVTDANNCMATTASTVTVNKVVPGVSGLLVGCDILSLTATGGTVYAWSGGSSSTAATNAFTSSGTYTLTVTDANNCTASTSVSLTVNTGLSVSVNSGTLCPRDAAIPLAATVSPSGFYDYEWQVPSGETNPGNKSTLFASEAGQYIVTVTSDNGCTGTATGTITVIGEEVGIPVISTIVQPTCAPPVNGKCGLSGLPTGPWTLYIDGSIKQTVSGTGLTYLATDLPEGVYRFWVVSQEGCASEKTSPFSAVLVTY